MSLPGLTLPGLTLTSTPLSDPTPTATPPRIHDLKEGTEYRFEVPFTPRAQLRLKLTAGTAELFGTELALKQTYSFGAGAKGAVYTWHGGRLEVQGEADEYVAEETPMSVYANVHFALEGMRGKSGGDTGPRVLVIGPHDSGKSSVVRILTAYAVKAGRLPVVVNLDPRQGVLSVPGSLTATGFGGLLDVEEGWGCSPISGPLGLPVKMPLVYHYGQASSEDNPKYFKPLVSRLALAVTSRWEGEGGGMVGDAEAKSSGCVIDTDGGMSTGKGGYENIAHIVSEFSVNVLLVLGSERLYSDMTRRFSPTPSDSTDPVHVIKLPKSGGCVQRDETYMKTLRHHQIRAYFFGHGNTTLSPYTQMVDFASLSIFRIPASTSTTTSSSYDPGADDDSDDIYALPPSLSKNTKPRSRILEPVEVGLGMQNAILAVTTADPGESHEAIRDASVLGYVYVADVDESKKKVKLLTPETGRVPARAIVWGGWPEGVGDLVG
ncbi:Clp1-domain-containing protein [Patellaria atrata CBS 101060]|uniref:Polynucleotide 5'-hydroxyl-kinase GRC3 n=1 Tax=Patellaria atrata CBS 101060 TaxID=1346257 RepID=A0A9P4VPD5_9PEZI|nr:Clp1-domain-containing protein [Patellaria atrata CBS 101060]